MKTLAIITLMMSASLSFAQGERSESKNDKLTVTEKAEKRTEKMTELLSLSEEQKEQVYQINIKHIENMDALKIERELLHQKIKSAKDITKSELDAVLSDEQKAILEQKKEEHMKKRKEKREKCQEQKHD